MNTAKLQQEIKDLEDLMTQYHPNQSEYQEYYKEVEKLKLQLGGEEELPTVYHEWETTVVEAMERKSSLTEKEARKAIITHGDKVMTLWDSKKLPSKAAELIISYL